MPTQRNIAGNTSGDNVKLSNVVLDVWSKELLLSAEPVMRYESVCRQQTDLLATPGDTIKFLRFNNLSGSSSIAETDTIGTEALSTSTVSVTVGEYGKGTSFSERLLRTSAVNVLDGAAQLLGRHYAKTRETVIRDVLLTAPTTLYANSKANRAALGTGDKFNAALVKDAVETLAVNKAPKMPGGSYICFVHPHVSRALRDDPAWVNVANTTDPSLQLRGEIGSIDDVRFVETTLTTYIKVNTQNIWSDAADTGNDTVVAANTATDVYQSIIVGDWAIGLADGLPVELRDDGVTDYGRTQKLAYYAIFGAGLIESGHVVILESA